ncbi:MAG TPA: SGNH/GDSL hydrolase family protein [Polyangia bacterium]|nr:SGNH/GDSL hydrolase family protein [Polyangia bacterium]
MEPITGRSINVSPSRTERLMVIASAFVVAVMTAAPGAHAKGPDAVSVPDRPFNMLCIGDSIMWGQGLTDEHKFSARAASWLSQNLRLRDGTPGRPVRRFVLAHSGAVIAAEDGEDAIIAGPGEVPSSLPSIRNQGLSRAQGTLAEHQIEAVDLDLILVDGGANDMNFEARFLNSDPISWRPGAEEAWVRRWAKAVAVDRMRGLIADLRTKFPSAKIVIVGYYPIISLASDLPQLSAFLRTLPTAARWLASMAIDAIRQDLTNKSNWWVDETDQGFAQIASDFSGGHWYGPVAFVPSFFGEANAFGAPDTLLWRLGEQDEVFADRAAACSQAGRSTDLICLNAAVGHPNPHGADQYAHSIINAIKNNWFNRWSPDRALVLDVTGTVLPGKVVTVNVSATDNYTGLPADGVTVTWPSHSAGAGPLADMFCTPGQLPPKIRIRPAPSEDAPEAPEIEFTTCTKLVITAPGYPDVHFDLTKLLP